VVIAAPEPARHSTKELPGPGLLVRLIGSTDTDHLPLGGALGLRGVSWVGFPAPVRGAGQGQMESPMP
jgi:hypothetical protein